MIRFPNLRIKRRKPIKPEVAVRQVRYAYVRARQAGVPRTELEDALIEAEISIRRVHQALDHLPGAWT